MCGDAWLERFLWKAGEEGQTLHGHRPLSLVAQTADMAPAANGHLPTRDRVVRQIEAESMPNLFNSFASRLRA